MSSKSVLSRSSVFRQRTSPGCMEVHKQADDMQHLINSKCCP